MNDEPEENGAVCAEKYANDATFREAFNKHLRFIQQRVEAERIDAVRSLRDQLERAEKTAAEKLAGIAAILARGEPERIVTIQAKGRAQSAPQRRAKGTRRQ